MDATAHYNTRFLGKTSRFARKTRHDFVHINKFLHGLTFKALGFFWVFLCNLIITLFRPIVNKISSFCRFEANKNKISNSDRICSNNFSIFEPNKNFEKKGRNLIDQPKFEENMEDFHDCCSDDDCSEDKGTTAGSNVSSKYEFSSGIHISRFIKEPDILSLTVHEGFGNQREVEPPVRRLNVEKVKQKHESDISEQKVEEFIQNYVIEKVLEEVERKIEADVVSDQKDEDSVTEKVVEEIDRKIDSDDEFIELEPQSQKFSASDEEISFRDISSQVPDKQQLEISVREQFSLEVEQPNSKFDDSEHEDIIEQIKLEIKNARKGGLPTISEDSNSPLKVLPELKPLKIDKKFEHKDQIAEVTMMYKSYSDKMKKLDVLNLQTIHATGFMQQKILVQSPSVRKSAVPALISTLSPGICKPRRPEAIEPMKCSAGLKNDFEMVYVGQLCLSWEILLWQYKKALEFRECDLHGIHYYNQVAGEFQLFQVLVQRFLENEPFQGQPRIENYVRSRSVLRSLLQVPVIIDDASRDKKQKNGEEEHSISIATLVDMIGESMHLLWEFINADTMTVKGPHQTSGNLQNPADLELVMEIRNNLHKKEKKMKEIVRSGGCIAKMFQKHEEHGTTLFAQVELKLIARVLSMSNITRDHLLWCHEKLHRINFCNRKIGIEPSFILFPC